MNDIDSAEQMEKFEVKLAVNYSKIQCISNETEIDLSISFSTLNLENNSEALSEFHSSFYSKKITNFSQDIPIRSEQQLKGFIDFVSNARYSNNILILT